MQYKFKKNGKDEVVSLERWAWGIVFRDENTPELRQFGTDGVFHQFVEIDQPAVKMMTMYRTDDPNMTKRIDMIVPEGAQIFHFYRNFVFDFMGEAIKKKVYVFGYKLEKQTAYHYILPDDRVVVASEDIDVSNFNL